MIFVHRPDAPLSAYTGVFLAGPTPRDPQTPSWRPDALSILEALARRPTNVYVPEREDWSSVNYDDQVEWEWWALSAASVVVFWVPRDLATMPGYTTNVEFGLMLGSKKPMVLGYPLGAPKVKYLDWHARRAGVQVCHTLEETLATALIRSVDSIG